MSTPIYAADALLAPTRLLDFNDTALRALVESRGWEKMTEKDRIGEIYDFVRNEIEFGYNQADDIPASKVYADGIGQCNTKGTLLMALLRAVNIRCRLHGFTIHKELQRGVVPELVYPLAPSDILHSWVEVWLEDGFISLEGFILDSTYLSSLQSAFSESRGLCGYGVGSDDLHSPGVSWCGVSTYIQNTGISQDLGVYDSPDAFYAEHSQSLGKLKDWLYRNFIRHWMNARVRKIRAGRMPIDLGQGYSNHVH